jgi:hypothetical protein
MKIPLWVVEVRGYRQSLSLSTSRARLLSVPNEQGYKPKLNEAVIFSAEGGCKVA